MKSPDSVGFVALLRAVFVVVALDFQVARLVLDRAPVGSDLRAEIQMVPSVPAVVVEDQSVRSVRYGGTRPTIEAGDSAADWRSPASTNDREYSTRAQIRSPSLRYLPLCQYSWHRQRWDHLDHWCSSPEDTR